MTNKLKIKSKFWSDALWFYPILMLILGGGFSVMMWRLSDSKFDWIRLSIIMNLLFQPIFLLLWIDSLSNSVIFEEKQVIFKGFFHKKKIEYANIIGISFSVLENATLVYFNQKLNRNEYMRMFIWNYSTNLVIDEIKKRTSIKVNGYPDKFNRRNLYAKIWLLVIMLLIIMTIDALFWKPIELKPQYKNLDKWYGLYRTEGYF
jgi:hypothetical protein